MVATSGSWAEPAATHRNEQRIYLCRLVCIQGNKRNQLGPCCWDWLLESCTCLRASRSSVLLCAVRENAWAATVSQGKAGWSSHEALPMILSWQPFVPAARHGNVAFATGGSYKVRAQCDCHTPRGPNTMWQGNRAHPENHQEFIIWPFLSGLIYFLFNEKKPKKINFFYLSCKLKI